MLVGNGKNLKLTPPEWFKDYPAFGMNTIHLYEGWRPTYYVAVDSRIVREFGTEIAQKYADLPKFVPTPNLDMWKGENFYRFYHRPGPLYPHDGRAIRHDGLLTDEGITYSNVMHVAMQIAFFMGFSTMLMIGVEHKPMYAQDHFWGADHGMSATPPVEEWLKAYKELVLGLASAGVTVLNISPDTYVPPDVIPRDDWRNYVS